METRIAPRHWVAGCGHPPSRRTRRAAFPHYALQKSVSEHREGLQLRYKGDAPLAQYRVPLLDADAIVAWPAATLVPLDECSGRALQSVFPFVPALGSTASTAGFPAVFSSFVATYDKV